MLGPPGRIISPPAASYWLSIAPALLAIYHSGLHHPPFVSAPIVSDPKIRIKLDKVLSKYYCYSKALQMAALICAPQNKGSIPRKVYHYLWDTFNSPLCNLLWGETFKYSNCKTRFGRVSCFLGSLSQASLATSLSRTNCRIFRTFANRKLAHL